LSTEWPPSGAKTVYESDQDEGENGEALKQMHGSCGYVKQQIRKERLTLYEWSKNDDDEELKVTQPYKRLFTRRTSLTSLTILEIVRR
ncbi:uncharacterized protein LAESUDRAFT_644731, partial [Laetiporus sulphureus 93-53]